MELTTEDRQRIEQEASVIYQEDIRGGLDLTMSHQFAFRKGAEYEHKYQREQQIKPLSKNEPIDDEGFLNAAIKGNVDLQQEIKRLETERAELLRENTALRAFLVKMTEGSAYFEKKVEVLFTQLNSLKTK